MKPILLYILLVSYTATQAQAYDRTWLIGSGDPVTLTFSSNSFDTASFNHGFNGISTDVAHSNISDTSGNVLLYCNGSQIGNRLALLMENGDTLIDSLLYNVFPSGFPEPQTNLIIPQNGNKFYLFYYSESDSLFATNTINEPDRLYYAIIDMNQNGGLGKVISKKNIAHKGIFGDCRLTACRHANGRDWWMVHQGFQSDEYFVYLVTSDSIYSPRIQHIGSSNFFNDNLGAQSVFSPDGSKFATVSSLGPLVLMNFDRCSGQFSYWDSIVMPVDTGSYNNAPSGISYRGANTCCFSKSGRFVYVSNSITIRQYDTWASNIGNTSELVGIWDSTGPIGGFLGFSQMYLTPNGKIIIDNYGSIGYGNFHLIDSPDVAGLGCHFKFNGLHTSTLNPVTLPNMINYRLGALHGSGCDTITGLTDAMPESYAMKLYPNPAKSKITVSLQEYHKDAKLIIYDAIGREMYHDESMYLSTDIDLRGFSGGVYTISVFSPDGNTSARFIVE